MIVKMIRSIFRNTPPILFITRLTPSNFYWCSDRKIICAKFWLSQLSLNPSSYVPFLQYEIQFCLTCDRLSFCAFICFSVRTVFSLVLFTGCCRFFNISGKASHYIGWNVGIFVITFLTITRLKTNYLRTGWMGIVLLLLFIKLLP